AVTHGRKRRGPVGWCRSMPIKPLSPIPLIHPTAEVRDSRLGAYTEVGARTRLLEVALGDYSYIVNDGEVAYATFGKFCSIASMARINPRITSSSATTCGSGMVSLSFRGAPSAPARWSEPAPW